MRERSRMVEFRRIQMLFLILVLQFSAITGQRSSFTVRDGDEVTLSCENVLKDQDECDSTTWLFGGLRSTAVVALINFGQIGEDAKAKSGRLSVTADCSLVIKKVTVEDVGLYTCRQFKSGQQQGQDSQVDLSVVTMTEQKNNNEVMLSCSVSTYDACRHTVKWLFKGKDVNKDNKDLKTSQSTCSATVSFLTSHFICTSNHELLKCKVTDLYNGKVQLYNISPQLSCEKPGVAETTTEPETTTSTTQEGVAETTTEPEMTSTTQEDADATTATTESTTIQSSTKAATTITSATKDATITSQGWWWYIIVAVGLAALLLTVVVVVIRRKKTTGNNIQMDENTDDPEGGVSYASISYTRKTDSKARVRGKDDADEDDAVTYSTVKASSSSAAASTDPSSLYTTIG
ncbi:papilin-like isoform X2 [Thunnus thynnus]|uniref:papilin-like isoform X2 n=1 Tax=Thunnus thynnus TaxID=8237 RepID=UPI0035276BC7